MSHSSDTIEPQNQNMTESSMPLPTGTPLTEWGGIPIMPGASAGEGDDSGYAFVLQASPAEVQQYFEGALTNLRWSILASSLDDSGAVLIIAMKEADMLTITVTPLAGGVMYVFLVK